MGRPKTTTVMRVMVSKLPIGKRSTVLAFYTFTNPTIGYDETIYPVDFRFNGHIVDDEMHRIMYNILDAYLFFPRC